MTRDDCPACGSLSATYLGSMGPDTHYYRCRLCGLTYAGGAPETGEYE